MLFGGGGGATKSDTDMAQIPQLTNKLKKIIRLSKQPAGI